MKLRHSLPLLLLLCSAGAFPLRAQDDDSDRDRPLEEMEARLQEQRATALRARLVIYSDELETLHARLAGDATAAAVVKSEMDAVQLAMRQLSVIARRQSEPPAAGELKEGEEISAAALAARRINSIIARFGTGKPAPRPERGTVSAVPRPHLLKADKAGRLSGYSSYSGREYWGYESAYFLWTLDDVAPGNYEVVLRYTADTACGGKAVVRIAGSKFEVTVPKGEKGGKEQRLTAGTVTITELGVDVRVQSGGLAGKATSLWDLEAVVLQPAAAKRP